MQKSMVKNFPTPLSCDEITFSFRLTISSVPEKTEADPRFFAEDELFTFTLGEVGKFSADSFYQNKLTVALNGKGVSFYGYSPDFGRKLNLIPIKGEKICYAGSYEFSLTFTKERAYVYLNGELVDAYGNARDGISGYGLLVREGVEIEFEDRGFEAGEGKEYPHDASLDKYLEIGAFIGYRYAKFNREGLTFYRMNLEQCFECTTRNFYAFSTGVAMDVLTDAEGLTLGYEVCDYSMDRWPLQFGFAVDGKRIVQPIVKVMRGEKRTARFHVPVKDGKMHRVTVFFPTSAGLALRYVRVHGGSVVKAYKRKRSALFVGDSITEGSECFDPAFAYVNAVAMRYDMEPLNQAIGGMSFGKFNILGDYGRTFDYVFVALGTNTFCGGTQEKEIALAAAVTGAENVIGAARANFPDCKIVALLPIWRSDEKGERFSLADLSEAIKGVYEREGVTVIDCIDFVPHDFSYYSDPNFAIHPNSTGHAFYSENLFKRLDGVVEP